MLNRLKSALVKSYAGAIAVGWLVAQGLTDVSSIFTVPITQWLTRRITADSLDLYRAPQNSTFPYLLAIPPLIRAALILLIAFLLLRWLYFPAAQRQGQDETSKLEQDR
jgi:hypothetical protein